jgi:hypothetical protein
MGKRIASLALVLVLMAASGCSRAEAEELLTSASTFAEKSAVGTLHWNVAPDGLAQLVVKNDAGVIQKGNVTGQLTFVTEDGKKEQTVPLALDEKAGVLRAEGPKLDDRVTEVRYALLLDGKPWTGALHVPKEGTDGLTKAAQMNSEPGATKGSHGGDVHVVDGQRYELVGDGDSGEVRVYPVDGGKKPKKLELALDADPPRRMELVLHADGYYFASVDAAKLPRKTTLIVVDDHDVTHVVVVGYRPGVFVVVDRPSVFWVARGWHPGRGRGHYKGTPFGPPGQNRGAVVVVDGHAHGHDTHVIVRDRGGKHKHKK